MKKILINTLMLFLFGCAATSEFQDKDEKQAESARKEKALSAFIDGTMAEMSSDFAGAILNYQEALKLDPTAGVHHALAENYFRLARLSPALDHAKIAAKAEPDNLDYQTLLATIYRSANLTDSAIAVLEKIAVKNPENSGVIYALAELNEQKKPSYSLELYKKLIDLQGPHPEVLIKIAEMNEKLGNKKATVETLEQFRENYSSDQNLMISLIMAYMSIGDNETALARAEEAAMLYPDDIALLELLARSYLLNNNWEDGIDIYSRLTEMSKVRLEDKLAYAEFILQKGSRDSTFLGRGREILEKMVSDSTDHRTLALLGELNILEKKDSAAVTNYKEASRLAPWNEFYWNRLGQLLIDKARYDEVKDELSKAISNFPDSYQLNLMLGLAFSAKENFIESRSYLEKAVRINSSEFFPHYLLGFTLHRLNEPQKAIEFLDIASRLQPGSPEVWGLKGLIYNSLEQWDKCDSAYSYAILLDPDNPTLLNNFAYALSERGIDLNRAMEMVDRALESEPENSSFLDTKGWILFQQGEYNDAQKFIYRSHKVNPESPEVLNHLGDVHFKLGEKDKAIEYWKMALELQPGDQGLKEKIERGEI